MIRKSVLWLVCIHHFWSIGSWAVTYVVDTSADAIVNDDVISLREAVQQANNNPGKDFIVMADSLDEGITLGGSALIITDSVEIDGTYSRLPTFPKATGEKGLFQGPIQVDADDKSRVFIVASDVDDVVIRDMIITSGRENTAHGGGVVIGPNSIVHLQNVTIAECQAVDQGGGIYSNQADLTLTDCFLRDNIAGELNTRSGSGGGISAPEGKLTLSGCRLDDNIAVFGGGGGINANGTDFTMVDTEVSNNQADIGGGIRLASPNIAEITGSIISGNTATDQGGGLYTFGDGISLAGTDVTGNLAVQGAGLFVRSGIAITGGSISGNTAGFQGGGAFFEDTALLTNTRVTENTADRGGGSGLYLETSAEVTGQQITVSKNTGGGIENTGSLTLRDATIEANVSAFSGGGIRSQFQASLLLDRVMIRSNTSEQSGGGLENFGSAKLIDTILSENKSMEGGGGCRNFGELTLRGGVVSDNRAGTSGGGIWNTGELGTLVLQGVEVQGNHAEVIGGGLVNDSSATLLESSFLDNESVEGGGAFYNAGEISVQRSLLAGNRAGSNGGGALSESGMGRFINSTISGNLSESGDGGGLSARSDTSLDFIHTTIADNHAGISGGGLHLSQAVVRLGNSILANNTAAVDGPNVFGSIASLDYNLIEDPSGGIPFGPVENSIFGMDPLLGPLADNGGPTLTHNLETGSPAIDTGNNEIAISEGLIVDQRGYDRIADIAAAENSGGGADIGAVEIIGIEVGDRIGLEMEGGIPFTVSISHPPPLGEEVTVRYDTESIPGEAVASIDFTPLNGGILSFPGTGPTSRTFSVPILDDTESEPNERFHLILSNAVGGTLIRSPAIGTIIDDENSGGPHFDYDFDNSGVVDSKDLIVLLKILEYVENADPLDFSDYWMERVDD